MHIALSIAIMTFVEIVMAVHGSIVTMRNKHYPSSRRKLPKTVISCGADFSIELIRFEDHGPRRKLLYVHEIHSDSREQYEETKARIRRDWDIKMIEELMNALG